MNKESKRYFALRLLNWFCPEHLYEEIEGDLIQKFNKDVKAVGEKSAKRRLIWNVVRFCRPGIVLKNRFTNDLLFGLPRNGCQDLPIMQNLEDFSFYA